MMDRLIVGLLCLAVAPSAALADMIWGANGHPIAAYTGVPLDGQLDLLQGLGMTSYRVDISDVGGAATLAELVEQAKPRGIAVLPVLTPAVDLDADSVEELHAKAYSLAVTLASRFKDDIRVWELGNELENHAIIQPCEMRDDGTKYPCNWGPAGGGEAADYYGPRWGKVSAVLQGLSEGIESVDPTIRKAMGTAGWGHTGAYELMKRDGIRWDISVWHTYGQDPEPAFTVLAGYGHPIWVTEFNQPYGSQNGAQQQADGLGIVMNRLLDLRDKYDVEAAYIYELLDEPYWAPDYQAVMGLVQLAPGESGRWKIGEPKPAFAVVKAVIGEAGPRRSCDLKALTSEDPGASRQINYAYCLTLGRSATDAELQQWTTTLADSQAGASTLLVDILGSEEFAGRYSTSNLTDRDYVALLYKLLLGREADQYGLDSWAKELASGAQTRTTVASGMVSSDEFKATRPVCFSS